MLKTISFIGGGYGTPGGSNTQVQYNNGGTFGGSPNLTFNGTTLSTAYDATIHGLTVGQGGGSVSTNTTLGAYALLLNTTGNTIVAIGNGALINNLTGSASTGVGYQALALSTTSNYNVGIGYQAGLNLTSGSNNIYIGASSQASSATANYEIVIGYNATGKGSSTGFINPNSGGVYQGNNSASWSTTSDQRIKENIVTLTGALDIINQLRPVTFNYKTGDKKKDISFIAQEYQQVLPDQVNEHAANEEEKGIAGTDTLLGLTPNLVPYLVKAIQELSAEIATLKQQLGK